MDCGLEFNFWQTLAIISSIVDFSIVVFESSVTITTDPPATSVSNPKTLIESIPSLPANGFSKY